MGAGRLRVAAGVGWAVALSFLARSALADDPAAVRVVVLRCLEDVLDVPAFTRTVAIELRADGVENVDVSPDASSPGTTVARPLATVTLTASPCAADARDVEIDIEDAATTKSVRRRLSLGDVARPARPRAIALAVAELLRASWGELRLPDAPPPLVTVPPAVRLAVFENARPQPLAAPPVPLVRPAPTPPVKPPPTLLLGAALTARFFPTAGSALLGAGVAASFGAAETLPLRLRLDAAALFGTAYEPTGSIATTLITGGAALLLAHGSGPVDVEAGPHVEAGVGRIAGTGTSAGQSGASQTGGVVELTALAALRVDVIAGFWTSVHVEVGGVLAGLASETVYGRSGGIDGVLAGGGIGLGRSF